MKLNDKFLLHETEDEVILVAVGGSDFSGIVRGNKTLAAILKLLKTDVTEEELNAQMRTRFDAPEGVIEEDVARALSELRRIGALAE